MHFSINTTDVFAIVGNLQNMCCPHEIKALKVLELIFNELSL